MSDRDRRRRRVRGALHPGLLGLPAIAVVVAGAVGCGSGSEVSAEAYCKAFYSKAAPIRQGWVNADQQMQQDPLAGIGKLLSAPGDLETIFDGMVPYAPDSIRSDTVEVRDAFRKEQDTMGKAVSDPLGAMGDALATSVATSGAFRRVDAYLGEHCPVNSPLAQKYIKEAQ